VITLARNFDFTNPRVLAGLTAKLLARLRYAPARNVGTFLLLNCGHRILLISGSLFRIYG
jgi:hypothetical protein